jgi:uncharacterized membrane protein
VQRCEACLTKAASTTTPGIRLPAPAAVQRVRRVLVLEPVLLAAIPLLATTMAHGVSSFR